VIPSSASYIPAGDPLVLLVIPSSSSSIPPGDPFVLLDQKLEEYQEKSRRPRKKVEDQENYSSTIKELISLYKFLAFRITIDHLQWFS